MSDWIIEAVADPSTCFALRHEVFVEEQGFSEAEEYDALDDGAIHLLASQGGVALGTARLILEDVATGRIGRICVVREARGTGLGAAIVQEGIARLQALGRNRILLGAQLRAAGFYARLGFVPSGPVYDDEGVPHQEMALQI